MERTTVSNATVGADKGDGYRHGWFIDVETGGSRPHYLQVDVNAELTYRVTVESPMRGKLTGLVWEGSHQDLSTKVRSGMMTLRGVHNTGIEKGAGSHEETHAFDSRSRLCLAVHYGVSSGSPGCARAGHYTKPLCSANCVPGGRARRSLDSKHGPG